MRTVSFITMGCAKNEVDSAQMADRLRDAGYAIVDDPADADAVIVNTCSFIQAATEESIEAILDAAELEGVARGTSRLVVAGCMPARYGEDLAGELPEVSAFVACDQEKQIASILDGLLGGSHGKRETDAQTVACARNQASNLPASAGQPFAYVKISDGCDRFCSYCTIPFIRGRYHSFSFAQISAEVFALVETGVREIVLIAQDTGRWGLDFDEPSSLARLVSELAERFADTWFRLMYIQPEGITDELIEAVASHGNICPYFDIPLQHSVARLLRAMNRKGSAAEYAALIERIRERIPHAAVRTTLIAGFPGETDEDFEELYAFVEDMRFDYVGVFAYSREEGTRAYAMDAQVDDDEKAYRAQRLRDIADSVCTTRIASRIGSETDVLVCGREEDGQLFGRAMCQAPEVDGETYLDGGEVGSIVRVRIVDTLMYEMEGEMLA